MLKDVLFAIWFFAPAGIANGTPIITAKLPGLTRLNAPMDFGYSFHGQRIFGAHKTWRGFISAIIMSTVTLALQQYLVAHFAWAAHLTSAVDYRRLPLLILGPLFGIGALGGDAIESFFKRQRHLPPGEGWFPFDQTDYIIGGALVTVPFVHLSFTEYILLILFWFVAHIVVTYLGFLVKLRDRPI